MYLLLLNYPNVKELSFSIQFSVEAYKKETINHLNAINRNLEVLGDL